MIHISLKAQDNNVGIKFEEGYSWSQIKEKAKKENKYIFIDTYTTWCGPCKQMDREIFTQKNVGDFFNKNFINIKVQIDSTNKDKEEIKKWYADAKLIQSTYKISLFPTFLFLNPDGNLVHEIRGGSDNTEEFISNSSAAINPSTQYNNLKKEFENGNRDTTFLKLLITTATNTHDYTNNKNYIKSYLKTQTNLFSKQNIEYIAASLETSRDIGYNIILNRPKEVLAVIEEQYRDYILNTIAFDEDILPLLRINGKKEFSKSGMINYTGEIYPNVDWESLQFFLNNKYKDRASSLIFEAKTSYYKWTNNWSLLNKTLLEYTINNKMLKEDMLCDWLNYFLLASKNENLKNALSWVKVLSITDKKSYCYKNYGIFLYKIGQKDEAIKVMLAHQEVTDEPKKDIVELIQKMKDGLDIL